MASALGSAVARLLAAPRSPHAGLGPGLLLPAGRLLLLPAGLEVDSRDVAAEMSLLSRRRCPLCTVFLRCWAKGGAKFPLLCEYLETLYPQSSGVVASMVATQGQEFNIAIAARYMQGERHKDVLSNKWIDSHADSSSLLHVFCDSSSAAFKLVEEIRQRVDETKAQDGDNEEDEVGKAVEIRVSCCTTSMGMWMALPATFIYCWEMTEKEVHAVQTMFKEIYQIWRQELQRFTNACWIGPMNGFGGISHYISKKLATGKGYIFYERAKDYEDNDEDSIECKLEESIASLDVVKYVIKMEPEVIKNYSRLNDDDDDDDDDDDENDNRKRDRENVQVQKRNFDDGGEKRGSNNSNEVCGEGNNNSVVEMDFDTHKMPKKEFLKLSTDCTSPENISENIQISPTIDTYNDLKTLEGSAISWQKYSALLLQLDCSEKKRIMLEKQYKDLTMLMENDADLNVIDDSKEKYCPCKCSKIRDLEEMSRVFNIDISELEKKGTHEGYFGKETISTEKFPIISVCDEMMQFFEKYSSKIRDLQNNIIEKRKINAELMLSALELGLDPSLLYTQPTNVSKVRNSNRLTNLNKILMNNLIKEIELLSSIRKELVKGRLDALIYEKSLKPFRYNILRSLRDTNVKNFSTCGQTLTSFSKTSEGSCDGKKYISKESTPFENIKKTTDSLLNAQIKPSKQKYDRIDKLYSHTNKIKNLLEQMDEELGSRQESNSRTAKVRYKMSEEVDKYKTYAEDIRNLVSRLNKKIDRCKEYFGTDSLDQNIIVGDIICKAKMDKTIQQLNEKISFVNTNKNSLSLEEMKIFEQLHDQHNVLLRLVSSLTSSPRAVIMSKRQEVVIRIIELSTLLTQWLEQV